MSFLSRIVARSRKASSGPVMLRPKAGGLLREAALEADADGEDMAQPLRRQPGPTLRRQQDDQETDAAEEQDAVAAMRSPAPAARSLRREATDPGETDDADETDAPAAAPLRRDSSPAEDTSKAPDEAAAARSESQDGEEEEEVQAKHQLTPRSHRTAIRREETEEPEKPEDEAPEEAPVARSQAEAGVDDAEEAQPLRRKTPPSPDGLTAENSPEPEETRDEPVPQLRAKAVIPQSPAPRPAAEVSAMDAPAETPHAVETAPGAPVAHAHEAFGQEVMIAPPHRASLVAQDGPSITQAPSRPKIHIDQVDVVIHEPAPATPARSSSRADRKRQFRARYLGGL